MRRDEYYKMYKCISMVKTVSNIFDNIKHGKISNIVYYSNEKCTALVSSIPLTSPAVITVSLAYTVHVT